MEKIAKLTRDMADRNGQCNYTATYENGERDFFVLPSGLSFKDAERMIKSIAIDGDDMLIHLTEDERENVVETAIAALKAQKASLVVMGFNESKFTDIDKTISILTMLQFGLDYANEVVFPGDEA